MPSPRKFWCKRKKFVNFRENINVWTISAKIFEDTKICAVTKFRHIYNNQQTFHDIFKKSSFFKKWKRPFRFNPNPDVQTAFNNVNKKVKLLM